MFRAVTWLLAGGPLQPGLGWRRHGRFGAPGRLHFLMAIAALAVCLLPATVAHTQGAGPSFDSGNYDREIAENTAAGQGIGSPVAATGGTGALTYTLDATGASFFDIVAASGQLRTKTGVTYDHEATGSYSVTVTAADTASMTATATVAITVTDVDEPPLAPTQVYGAADHFTYDQYVVRWVAPDNTGRPAITGYEVQSKEFFDNWPQVSQIVAGTETTITGIVPRLAYLLRVRARNAEGAGPWAVPGGIGTGSSTPRRLPIVVLPWEIEPGYQTGWERDPDMEIIPPDLGPGDDFRLLFVTYHGIYDAASKEPFDHYDKISEAVAASAIGYARFFVSIDPVASTESFNAQELSRTTYTEENKGGAHLLDGGQQGCRRLRGLLGRHLGRRDQPPRPGRRSRHDP